MAGPNLGAGPSPRDFASMRGFDVNQVPVPHARLDGYTAVLQNTHPADYTLVECCDDPACRCHAYELVLFLSAEDLAESLVHETIHRWPGIPPGALISGVKLDVYRIRTSLPVPIASLRDRALTGNVSVSLRKLRAAHESRPKGSAAQEIVLAINDIHQPCAIELPLRQWENGRDLMVFRNARCEIEFENLGLFGEAIPIAAPRAAFWLDVFARVYGGPAPY